jgi:hypothetical protein
MWGGEVQVTVLRRAQRSKAYGEKGVLQKEKMNDELAWKHQKLHRSLDLNSPANA